MERNVRCLPILLLCASLLCGFDIAVSWNPNTESDLAGYNVSYDGPSSDSWVNLKTESVSGEVLFVTVQIDFTVN